MAKTIYDYWFVQFDFPDKNGKPYKSSGGKMVWNNELKRDIPEGWDVKPLEKTIEIIIDYRGKTPKKLDSDWSFNSDDIVALSAKHVKEGKLVNLESANRVNEELYSKWMKDELCEGDILLTSEAPCGEFFYLVGKTKYCLSQRLFAIRSNIKIVHHSYLFFELSKGNGISQILGKVSGSTVFGIRQDELRTVNILIPNMNLQDNFASIILPIYCQIRNNDYQTEQLAALRDWLLPMLMNGQVKVNLDNYESNIS
jgi:type I restriction enzyme S subunit